MITHTEILSAHGNPYIDYLSRRDSKDQHDYFCKLAGRNQRGDRCWTTGDGPSPTAAIQAALEAWNDNPTIT
jgi:hypothetical protein